jgi:adenylate cyclase
LVQAEIALASRRRPENLTAYYYYYYLRAIQQSHLATREGVAETLRLARRALELDSLLGPAATLAGRCHHKNVTFGYTNDPQFERKEAVRLVRLASSLDEGDPDTLAWAAVILAFVVGSRESEMKMADRAVSLNPNSYHAWGCRGHVYNLAGHWEEAVRSFEHRIRLSPVDRTLHLGLVGMASAFIELGRFDGAIVAAKQAHRQNVCAGLPLSCLRFRSSRTRR